MDQLNPVALIGINEVGDMFGIKRGAVRNLVKRGVIPPPMILIQTQYWHKDEIEEVQREIVRKNRAQWEAIRAANESLNKARDARMGLK